MAGGLSQTFEGEPIRGPAPLRQHPHLHLHMKNYKNRTKQINWRLTHSNEKRKKNTITINIISKIFLQKYFFNDFHYIFVSVLKIIIFKREKVREEDIYINMNKYKCFIKNSLKTFIWNPNVSGEILPLSMDILRNLKKSFKKGI